MKLLQQHIESLGLAETGLAIKGTLALTFSETRDAPEGKVDVYLPTFGSLSLERHGQTVLNLGPRSEMFAELAATLGKAYSLPLSPRVVLADAPAPEGKASFTALYKQTLLLAKAEADYMDAFLADDQERQDEAAWQRFQLSTVFAQHPCPRDEYFRLRGEMLRSTYPVGLDFRDYYEWHAETAALLAPEGGLTPEAQEQAAQVMDALAAQGLDLAGQKRGIRRVLRVHPLHFATFDAFADERAAQAAPEAEAAAPGL